MGRPGPTRHLRSVDDEVREGNPSKKGRRARGIQARPERPDEPDWRRWFPSTSGARKDADKRCRDRAREEWRTVVPLLDSYGVLARADLRVLSDYCVCVARIDECERDISLNGIWVEGERGAQKNPSTTTVNQYRTTLRFYLRELFLTPDARASAKTSGGADDGEGESPWD